MKITEHEKNSAPPSLFDGASVALSRYPGDALLALPCLSADEERVADYWHKTFLKSKRMWGRNTARSLQVSTGGEQLKEGGSDNIAQPRLDDFLLRRVHFMDPNNETNHPRLDALTKISRRAADLKAALKDIQARQRAQERADRERIAALIGTAILADAEADTDLAGDRRLYIRQILDQQIISDASRAFLTAKGWL